jgi:AbrB family looped-hinge helix DNA binding protein
MQSTLTSNGQVTIPKKIRDALKLQPGCKLNVTIDSSGSLMLEKARVEPPKESPRIAADKLKSEDRFEQVRGKASVHWRTQELMNLLRGEN